MEISTGWGPHVNRGVYCKLLWVAGAGGCSGAMAAISPCPDLYRLFLHRTPHTLHWRFCTKNYSFQISGSSQSIQQENVWIQIKCKKSIMVILSVVRSFFPEQQLEKDQNKGLTCQPRRVRPAAALCSGVCV